jgi:hypothetical protein
MHFRRKIQTLRALDSETKAGIAEALILHAAVSVGFSLIGVPRCQRALRRWALAWRSAPMSDGQAESALLSARRAQKLVLLKTRLGGTCLVRSLALWAMLLRRGIETDLRVGMRKANGKIEGHAWLEYLGSPLNESGAVVDTYSTDPTQATLDFWRGRKSLG